ncbi:MAG: VWA domain-containing protein [Myxococcales bacterium]|nr:VWA domain-containing protein [Myxococcales bacterium]
MSEFRFAEPGFVHVLWIVLALALILVALERRSGGALGRLVGPSLRARLVEGPANWRRFARIGLLALSAACLVLALMRPQWGLRHVATPRVGAEIMIALDVSRSMLAEDVAPNRLERAKAEIVDLLAHLRGDQVGLIAFAGRASVLSPLTPDFSFLRLVLDGAGPRSAGRGGTRLEEPIRKAIEGFGEPSGASRVLLLITDGEDHGSFPLDAAADAAEAGVTVIAIGFGDEAGSEIRVTDARTGASELLRDADGRPVTSRLDGVLLRDIALATGGAYVPAGTGVLDLESIYREHIAGLTRGSLDPRGRSLREEAYAWCVLAALVLLFAGVAVVSGPAVVALALVLFLWLPAPTAGAAEAELSGEVSEEAAGAPAPRALETPRERYNRGVEALQAGDFEEAERWLAEARSTGGDDLELRFRASYDLGFAAVQGAGRLEAEAPGEALDSLHRGADWFREAVSLRPENEAARANLEVALRRALLLADRLAREREGGLEQELQALAQRQREIAASVVGLQVREEREQEMLSSERLRREYRELATSERTLLAEADQLAARLGEEWDALKARPEEELGPEDAARGAQLAGVLHYLHRARERMGQTRSQLRKRQGERAYRRSAAALGELLRALDQLMDPLRVLDALLRDQHGLSERTRVSVEAGDRAGGEGLLPAPLATKSLAEAQTSVAERIGELHLRMRAGLDAESEPPAGDSEAEALWAAIERAAPLVSRARDRCRDATAALQARTSAEAVPLQREALQALADARELFLDLRGLVEATYAAQVLIESLLVGQEEALLHEARPALAEAQRSNLARGERLAELLAREREAAAAAAAGEEPAAGAETDLERLDLAARLLPLAVGAMRDAHDIMDAEAAPTDYAPARSAARDARERLATLRRLFFSIVEHVREAAERQLALADRSRDAEALWSRGDAEGSERVGELAAAQASLADRTLILANEIGEQSAEALRAEDPAAEESATRLREAAEQILLAEGAMRGAHDALTREPAAFPEVASGQQAALSSLARALALLEPPQQEEQGDSGSQPEEGSPGSDAAAQQQQAPSQAGSDPAQLLQGVRDREAQRRRERAEAASGSEATVEKDW